jgi:hypothetical protein
MEKTIVIGTFEITHEIYKGKEDCLIICEKEGKRLIIVSDCSNYM